MIVYKSYQAWELATDPRISVGKKKMSAPLKLECNGFTPSYWQNWKMQGCFMQFLHLIFCWKASASGGFAQAPTFQLTFPFLIPMPAYVSLLKQLTDVSIVLCYLSVHHKSYCMYSDGRQFFYHWGQKDCMSSSRNHLVGLVVRRPPREQKTLCSNPACSGIFSGLSHTSDFKIGTPESTLPGTWHYRVNTGTGWASVSILWLGEMESLVCNSYLSVAAHKIVWADPSLRYTSMLLGR